jgi:putative peptidoglycan lipid II flippase
VRWLLGLGATVGIALQALVLIPAVRSAGVRLRLRPRLRHPAVREVARLSTWTFGFVAANQIAALVIANLALGLGAGQQDAYVKASIVFLFPHGLLAMSIAITFVPELSRSVARHERTAFVRTSTLGIRLVALVTMPAAFLLFALRTPVVSAFFRYGEFSADDVTTTARALAGFSIGLAGFSVYLFVLRGFYAHRDTRTPFILSVVQNSLNIVLAVALFGRYGVLGLGLAYGVSYVLSALLAVRVLANKVHGFDLRSIAASVVRMAIAGVVAAEVAWLVVTRIGSGGRADAIADLVVGITIGLAMYVALLMLMKVDEIDLVRARLSRATARDHHDG